MEYDLFVIGGGSGGVRAARWAASRGANVALCESDRMGGTCVIRGCVPKKLMSYAGKYKKTSKLMESFGLQTENIQFDWNTLKQNRDREIERLEGIYGRLLSNTGVDVIKGHGQIVSKNEVKVGESTYKAKSILIATGGKPYNPLSIPGSEHIISSDQIFHLENFPKKLFILGAGYIALEFASIFNGLGSEVHVVLRKSKVLSGFDEDVQTFLQNEMEKNGIQFHYETQLEEIQKVDDAFKVKLSDSSESMDFDCVFGALGRIPNTDKLGLENLGIEMNGKAIKVDEKSETSVKNIFAVGDVTNRMNLTPVALEEGMLVAEYLFEGNERVMKYENIATAVFTTPEVSTLGLTEQEAKDRGLDIEVFESNFRALKYTLSSLDSRTYMKMIVDKKSQKILGLHMAGDDAGEMMQGLAVAVKAGATKEHFDRTIGIHPTSAEEWTTLRTPRE